MMPQAVWATWRWSGSDSLDHVTAGFRTVTVYQIKVHSSHHHHTHRPLHHQQWAVCPYHCPLSILSLTPCIANKPRGLQAARKLRTDRRENRWVCVPCVILILFLMPFTGR
jgi:hypothetical protein